LTCQHLVYRSLRLRPPYCPRCAWRSNRSKHGRLPAPAEEHAEPRSAASAVGAADRARSDAERPARTTAVATLAAAQNAPRVCPRTTNGLGVGQYAARGKLTSSVTAEVVLPYNLPYKSRHLPSSAIVARLHQRRSGRIAPSRVTPSNPLYRFHTAEVGGSSPLAPITVMSRDIADRRTYAGYVIFAFGARGW
jgi:hypothetical protein